MFSSTTSIFHRVSGPCFVRKLSPFEVHKFLSNYGNEGDGGEGGEYGVFEGTTVTLFLDKVIEASVHGTPACQ